MFTIPEKRIAAFVTACLLAAGAAGCSRAPERTGTEQSGLAEAAAVLHTEYDAAMRIKNELQKTAVQVREAWNAGVGSYDSFHDPDAVRCLQELDKQKLLYPDGVAEEVRDSEGSFVIRTTGGYVLSPEDEQDLQTMLESVYAPGFTMGFVLMDLMTGKGVLFNTDETYYSASSSKASFVVSLIKEKPEVAEKRWPQLVQLTVNSDNDSYFMLEYDYGQDIHVNYAAEAGVSLVLDEGGFADLSAEDLTRLWISDYDYFCTGEKGEEAGSLLETPTYSAICSAIGSQYVTRTKPGWIAGQLHNASIDAGIVYADGHPYVMTVMTDFPSSLEDLQETVYLLDRLHTGMVETDADETEETRETQGTREIQEETA